MIVLSEVTANWSLVEMFLVNSVTIAEEIPFVRKNNAFYCLTFIWVFLESDQTLFSTLVLKNSFTSMNT